VNQAAQLKPDKLTVAASLIGFAILLTGCFVLFFNPESAQALPAATALPEAATVDHIPFATASRSYGYGLFTKYMLPFQVIGFLLLIAMIGVIVVSKKITASGNTEQEGPRKA